MMNIKMHVTYADGSGVDVDTSMPDFIAFERKYDKPVQAFAGGDIRIEYMCFLAWNNLKRRKKTETDFDDWLELVDEIKVGEEEDIVPLETEAPTGS